MFLGAVLALVLETAIQEYLPYLLVIAAGSFIYVAMSDLIPAIDKKLDAKELSLRILLVPGGKIVLSLHYH